MGHRLLGAALVVLGAAASVACSGGSGGGGGGAPPAASGGAGTGSGGGTAAGGGGSAPVASSTLPALSAAREASEGRFSTSDACYLCHSNRIAGSSALRDTAGRGVAPYDLWQASMMANAARDPIYRAAVSIEMAATPSAKAAIQDKCLTCHAPMARTAARDAGQSFALADLTLNTDRAQLGLDGVSCTLCHQIQAPTQASATFDGNYPLNSAREIYGPHGLPFAQPMSNRTGYVPVEASHVTRAAHCASCHTLRTSALSPAGAPTGGRLQEQTPYLEWRNSVFNDELPSPGAQAASCQSCHVPTRDLDGNQIRTKIADSGNGFPIQPRDPFGRHLYVGGNTLVPQILKAQRASLNPRAPDAALDEVVARTRAQLQQRSAQVSLGTAQRSGDVLEVPVRVVNLAGHKFPTGHPNRRAWLRFEVRAASGAVVFLSGDYDSSGQIVAAGVGLASERAGGPTHPHYDRIERGDQVQIYQSLMGDAQGTLTFLLLRGERYLKDNRLLPQGWSPSHADASATAPVGTSGDADFLAGEDTVRYRFSAPASGGPYQVQVRLVYSPFSTRVAAEYFRWNTPEVTALQGYYQAADRRPELVAQASGSVN